MKRTQTVASALVVLGLAASAVAAERRVEDLIPADAILALCTYGGNPDVEQTALYQLIQEPEVQEWLGSVWKSVTAVDQPQAQFALAMLRANLPTIRQLLKSQIGIAVLPGGGGAPQVLVAIRVGKAREAVMQLLGPLLAMAGRGGRKGQVAGMEVTMLGPGGACYGFQGDTLFFTSATGALERALAPQTAKLSSLPSFQRALGMGSSPIGLLAYNHVALMKAFGPMIPDEVKTFLAGTGLDKSELIALRLGAKGRALVGSGVIRTQGPRTGLLAAFPARPVDRALLKLAPRDAGVVWAASVSPPHLYTGVVGVIHTMAAPAGVDFRGGLGEFEGRAGVSLERDVFAALGEDVVVTTSGKSFLPALIISVAARDGARFDAAVPKLVAQLDVAVKADFGDEAGAALKTIEFRGHTIRYLATPGLLMPFAPCYARAGGRVVFGLTPVHLKDYLQFLDAGEPSVLDNPRFQALADRVPANAASVGYSDVGEGVIQLYSILGPLLTVVQGIPGIPLELDLANLPSKRVLRKHLFGSISYTYATEDTLVYECQSPFGFGFIGPAPSGAPAALLLGVGAGMAVPAIVRARGEARRVVSMNNMRQIQMASMVFLNDHAGLLPASLDVLVKGKLLADGKILVAPNDPDPPKGPGGLPCSYVYFLDAYPRLKVRMDAIPNPARTPVLWERQAFGRGRRGGFMRRRNVAFADGHVETVFGDRFGELKREVDALLKTLAEKQGMGKF